MSAERCVCGHERDMHDHRGTCWGWRTESGQCMSSCKEFRAVSTGNEHDDEIPLWDSFWL